MASQNSGEGSSSGNVPEGSSDSTMQLNIKTLESQIYSVQADKNMLVLSLKEKIANEIGVPVGQQRLIFRGKVLKDDHPLSEYHVESGHTLHLVARQPAHSQESSGPSSGETGVNENLRGNDPNGSVLRNRIGQISHSVVLGTFNVGDQGEGGSPDISRVIGAVLNSMGIGNQTMANVTGGMSSINMSNNPGTSPLENGTEGTNRNVGGPTQTGNQAQSGQAIPSQLFQSLPQALQIPIATSTVPLPTLNTPIPSSLTTISEFINRMEQALSQSGDPSHTSSNSAEVLPSEDLPSNAHGLHTPEALSIVLRQAERLLSNQAAASLSHIARGLEQERESTDLTTRGQIQSESVRVGLAIQHLGALFLELGRAIMTLRMGNNHVESFVNSGPAVYISPSGPNPIMVQPFPLQSNSLFSGSIPPMNSPSFGPVGIGAGPRSVNIHIHAGTSLGPMATSVGTRSSPAGDGRQGEQISGMGPADSRAIPLRNIIRPAGIVMPNAAQPVSGASDVQPHSNPGSLSSLMSEVNSQIRSLAGQAESNIQNLPAPLINRDGEIGNDDTRARTVNGDGESNLSLPRGTSQEGCEATHGVSGSVGDLTSVKDSDHSVTSHKLESRGETAPGSSKMKDTNEDAKAVPLGLGFGGLARKRRAKQQKPPGQSGDTGITSAYRIQPHQLRSNQQVRNSGLPSAQGGSDGQPDMASVMSQVLQSPALNGLLSGVSEQTGVGSPDALRNMLQHFTQSPQMRNVVNQIAEQVDTDEVESMFGEAGGQGGGGGLDLSRMFQQMMPIVSRALGASGATQPQSQFQSLPQFSERSQSGYETNNQSLQSVAQMIEDVNAPEDIFRTLVENSLGERGLDGVVDELCSDEDLVNEYIALLQRELRQRFKD